MIGVSNTELEDNWTVVSMAVSGKVYVEEIDDGTKGMSNSFDDSVE